MTKKRARKVSHRASIRGATVRAGEFNEAVAMIEGARRRSYQTYRSGEIVSPLVRQLPWTHHLIILSRAGLQETREFYVLAAILQRVTKRGLERQIRSGAALRASLRGGALLHNLGLFITEFARLTASLLTGGAIARAAGW